MLMCSLVGQESVWEKVESVINTPCHIYITGAPGSGKSTIVREFIQEYARRAQYKNVYQWGVDTNDDCLLLSSEQDRGIQTIRGYVSLFIRQRSLGHNKYRWVIIDDVDTFPQISQQALRRPMESYSHITRFIFIGTSYEDLIPALRSRCIHISMNTINPFFMRDTFLHTVNFSSEHSKQFTEDMWIWMVNLSGNNVSDLIRLLILLRDTLKTYPDRKLSSKLIQTMCSAPFYMDFFPFLEALSNGNMIEGANQIIHIWKRGYTFEDILESCQLIHTMFIQSDLDNNIRLHTFLVNAWISYCKGNTSILALQNIYYKTLNQTSSYCHRPLK